ncbi:hypothetical protein ACLBW9_21140 [Methylobacterium mesophilicum]
MLKLEVHLNQRLLHVLNRRGGIVKRALLLTHVSSQLGDLHLGSKIDTQQAVRVKQLQPLGIADIDLTNSYVLGIATIVHEDHEPTPEYLEIPLRCGTVP